MRNALFGLLAVSTLSLGLTACDDPQTQAEKPQSELETAPDLTLTDAERAPTPSIHPELAAHTDHFEKQVYKVTDNVYAAVGWGLANTLMIEGTDGVIIVDPGISLESAQLVEAELRKITDKPVKAVVYTHFHPDHWGGVKAFVSEQEVASGAVDIIAHETLLENVVRQGGLVGPIQAMRSGYTFGVFLAPEDVAGMNGGIGPAEGAGTATFIAPTKTIQDRLETVIAGVEMEIFFVPSEAPDEIAVYLPKTNLLLSAEVIQGPTLPNIHTLRGTKFRDPVTWVRSIDLLRSYKADYMVPSHGQPLSGADKVEEVLTMTRDGIQFVHDQTIRHMNKGLTPDELAGAVAFPPHLAGYTPYLREYYGTVKHSVRQIYTGYLGWFAGDPTALDPTAPVERAKRHVELMGGRDNVLASALKAFRADDPQWAAELTTYLIRINHEDEEAKALKAAALRKLGYASMNINWRNWYLTSAMELEGKIEPIPALRKIAANFASPDVIAQWPMEILIEGLAPRLRAQASLDTHIVAGFKKPDGSESGYGLEIRRGVAQFHPRLPAETDFTLTLDRNTLIGLSRGLLSLEDGMAAGKIDLTGDLEKAKTFLAKFDPPAAEIWLTRR